MDGISEEELDVMRLVREGMQAVRGQLRDTQRRPGNPLTATQQMRERRARGRDVGVRAPLPGDMDVLEFDRELIGDGRSRRLETPPPPLEEMRDDWQEASTPRRSAARVGLPPEGEAQRNADADERRRVAIAAIASDLEAERRAEILLQDDVTGATSAPWGVPFSNQRRPFVRFVDQTVASFHGRRCLIRNVTREVVRLLAPVRRLGDIEQDVAWDELDLDRQEQEAMADNAAASANEAWARCVEEAVRELRYQVQDYSADSTTVPDDYNFFDLLDAEHVSESLRRAREMYGGGGLAAARRTMSESFEARARRRGVVTPETAAARARNGESPSREARLQREEEEESMLAAVRAHMDGDTLPQYLRPRGQERSRRAEQDIVDDFRRILRRRDDAGGL